MDVIRNDLELLYRIDELKTGTINNRPLYYHKEHRFALPLIYYAQLTKKLPKPCNLILFDQHHDMAPVDEIYNCRPEIGVNEEITSFIDYCQNVLSKLDDNWITAGFEIGIIKDVIAFGVRINNDAYSDHTYKDKNEGEHKVYINSTFPSHELYNRGILGDIAKMEQYQEIHNILDWGIVKGEGFRFLDNRNDLIVSIDLDCFAIEFDEAITFPWHNKIFHNKFTETFPNSHTPIKSGREFNQKLMEKCNLVTIAREPEYCGGESDADEIFTKMNKYMFDNKIELTN